MRLPRFPALLLLLAALVPAPARAGTGEEIDQARDLLRELREEEVIRLLTRTLDRGDATAAQLAEIYVLLGLARHGLLDEEGARLAFRRSLRADGAATLPKHASPKARTLFEEVRVALVKESAEEEAEARKKAELEEQRRALERARKEAEAQRHLETPAKPPPAATAAKAIGGTTDARPAGTLSATGIAGIGATGLGIIGLAAGEILRRGAVSGWERAVGEPEAMKSEGLYLQAVAQNSASHWATAAGAALVLAGGTLIALPLLAPGATETAPQVLVGPASIGVSLEF